MQPHELLEKCKNLANKMDLQIGIILSSNREEYITLQTKFHVWDKEHPTNKMEMTLTELSSFVHGAAFAYEKMAHSELLCVCLMLKKYVEQK